MRLWHKDLIPVLPRQQLLGQWRECCLIAKQIAEQGEPHHILVNRIMDYPITDFIDYTNCVAKEMDYRGYNVNMQKFWKWLEKCAITPRALNIHYGAFIERDIFPDWHNDRYLVQCYYNLQEKYDCGGIPEDEWERLCDHIGYTY